MSTPVDLKGVDGKGSDSQVEQLRATATRTSQEAYDKQQLDREQAQQLATGYVPDTDEEKAIVKKLDWRLVVSRSLDFTPARH